MHLVHHVTVHLRISKWGCECRTPIWWRIKRCLGISGYYSSWLVYHSIGRIISTQWQVASPQFHANVVFQPFIYIQLQIHPSHAVCPIHIEVWVFYQCPKTAMRPLFWLHPPFSNHTVVCSTHNLDSDSALTVTMSHSQILMPSKNSTYKPRRSPHLPVLYLLDRKSVV